MRPAATLVAALRAVGVPCGPEGTYAFTRGPTGGEEVVVTLHEAAAGKTSGEWHLLVDTAVTTHYTTAGAPPPAAVHVVLPPPRAALHHDLCPAEDAAWMRAQAAGVASFVHDAVHTLARVVYGRATEALPWRARAQMEAAVPLLAANAAQRVAAGLTDPVLRGTPDAILPRLCETLRPHEVRDMCAHLGDGATATLFDLYAAVYTEVRRGGAPAAARKLYAAAFETGGGNSFEVPA